MLILLCDTLTVKTVKRVRSIRGSGLVHITLKNTPPLKVQYQYKRHLHQVAELSCVYKARE